MKEKSTVSVPRLRGADYTYRYFHQWFIAIFTVLAIAVMCCVSESFRSAYNLGNLMNTCFPLILAALGQFIIILTSGIDLSIGSILTLGNCVSVYFMTKYQTGTGLALAIIMTVLVGLACGAINGLFVAKFRLPSIIVTIATSAVFQGMALVVMPEPGGTVSQALKTVLKWKAFKLIPLTFFLAVLAVALLLILTNKTSFGRSLRAIGGNESAAYGSGIRVERTKFLAYVLAGLLAALSGLYLSARTSTGDPNIGNNYTIYSISATVVGGTMMSGAVGQSYGTAFGAVIIFLVNNVLNMLDVSAYYQYMVQGAVLVFALIVGSFESRRKN